MYSQLSLFCVLSLASLAFAQNNATKPYPYAGTTLAPLMAGNGPIASVLNSVVASQMQSFFKQLRLNSALELVKEYIPNLISRSPTGALTVQSLVSFNLVSIAVLIFSVFITYFIYPMFDSSWTKRVSDLNFDFGSKVNDIQKRVTRAIDAYSHLDPDVCAKIAICTLSKDKQQSVLGRTDPENSSQMTVVYEIADHVLR